jgi:hypothetical protein
MPTVRPQLRRRAVPTRPISPELAAILDSTVLADDEALPVRRGRKAIHQPAARLSPLPGAFARVPIQWLRKPGRDHIFRPQERLFIYLLYRSHWGQRGVPLTDALITEIGITRRNAQKIVQNLTRAGWVRVEQQPGHLSVVWPVVLAA